LSVTLIFFVSASMAADRFDADTLKNNQHETEFSAGCKPDGICMHIGQLG
jgi:hypothetical protein